MASLGTLAALLRELREARRLSLSEAARRADVSRTTLRDWESGAHAPPGPALERLLDAVRADPRDRAAILASAAPQHAQVALAGEILGPPVGRGAILRAMRNRRGLTQGAVAGAMGATQGAVAKWESGDSVPGEETAARLMALLGSAPEEAAAFRRAGDDGERLTLEGAVARAIAISLMPDWNAREPLYLAHEAEVWRRAVRDPAWEPALVQTMGWRAVWTANVADRPDEGLALARRTLRLAARCGAWDEATIAFFVVMERSLLACITPEQRARILQRSEAYVPRLKTLGARSTVEQFCFNLIAAEERGRGGMADAVRRLEDRLGRPGGELLGFNVEWHTIASTRIFAFIAMGRFDEASEAEATTSWEGAPFAEVGFAMFHRYRMWRYLEYDVEPTEDDLRRFEAYGPFYDLTPALRHTVRDWHRAHDVRKRRRSP